MKVKIKFSMRKSSKILAWIKYCKF